MSKASDLRYGRQGGRFIDSAPASALTSATVWALVRLRDEPDGEDATVEGLRRGLNVHAVLCGPWGAVAVVEGMATVLDGLPVVARLDPDGPWATAAWGDPACPTVNRLIAADLEGAAA